MAETNDDDPSYHDVCVYVDGVEYRIFDNYAYWLICTRAGGWELWYKWENKERQIGGEYHGNKEFCIEVKGIPICGRRQTTDATKPR